MNPPPEQCPKCGASVVPLRTASGKGVVVMGRQKFGCSRLDDPQRPCDFVAFVKTDETEQACCPHCGCKHLLDDKVTHSEIKGGSRRRRRICRSCGLPVFTREFVESA